MWAATLTSRFVLYFGIECTFGGKLYTFIFLSWLIASAIGAIAGIGGGVIIRPVLDSFHVMAATVSFLSGCTVLSMSATAPCGCKSPATTGCG